MNDELVRWTGPQGLPRFDLIADDDFAPAFDAALAEAEAAHEAIAGNPAAPTFENTLERMERSSVLLNRTTATFYNLTASDGTPEIQAVETEVGPKLARFQSQTYLDKKLFGRIDALYQKREALGLTEEQARRLAEREGFAITVKVQDYGDVAYGWAMEDSAGLVKLIARKDTGQLLGAHLIGTEASILIQPLVQAMSFGLDAHTMARGQYWIHPALSEVVENALLGLDVPGTPGLPD